VVTLRAFAEQYTGGGQLQKREVRQPACGIDQLAVRTDARRRSARGWVGKPHLTETCDGRPHLIVNVATTPATTPDDRSRRS
jgi:hypothetical protein